MHKPKASRHLWAWNLSARVYERAYIHIAHQVDADVLAYLGAGISGATIADCGCGPGVVAAKLLQAGAGRVLAIDSNAAMIARARRQLAKAIANRQALVLQASHEDDTLRRLCQQELAGQGLDMILFKRSLYMPRPRALQTLRQAAAALRSAGVLVVVHPERSLRRYAFAPPYGITSYTLFHLGNRAISRLLEWCGAEEYTLYSAPELLALLHEAVPEARLQCLPSQQRPYNIVALHMP